MSSSGSPNDGPFDMIFYDDVKHGYEWAFFIFAVNNEGDFLITGSVSAHFILGGHASIALNMSEYFERLMEW